MIQNKDFKQYPLSFPETLEAAHFENVSFKVKNKIFVTHNAKENRCCVKLSAEEQPLFCMIDKEIIFPVPNKWGKHGWTLVNLQKIDKELLMEILTAAYCCVAPPKLSAPFLKQIDSF
jgi:predicted DNA-binding protein (MmcQ/YjbR family)